MPQLDCISFSSRALRGALLLLSLAALLGATGCATATVGVRGVDLPPDAAGQCVAHCQTIGLELSAVAIMANNVGCVCKMPSQSSVPSQGVASPPGAVAPSPGVTERDDPASAAPGGMAAIVMQQRAEEQRQESEQTRRGH